MASRAAIAALAARGAGNPEQFAAYLAQRARGGQQVLSFAADTGYDGQVTCPNCGTKFAPPPSGDPLQTPAPNDFQSATGMRPEQIGVAAGSASGALANQLNGVELAAPRYPVTSADDVLISRSQTGGAAVRHRRGGTLIGEIKFDEGWKAVYGGQPQQPHSHQRGALAELLGLWNRGTPSLAREAAEPLQPPPVQTELMQQYGVPAIRALATPANGASAGPRVTMANGNGSPDGDGDGDGGNGGGLGPRGQAVYKKLKAKGWPDAKAMLFAKQAEKNAGKIGG